MKKETRKLFEKEGCNHFMTKPISKKEIDNLFG